MDSQKTITRSIRMNEKVQRALFAAAKYYGCTIGNLIALMVNATFILDIDEENLPPHSLEKFIHDLKEHSKTNTYLFKD